MKIDDLGVSEEDVKFYLYDGLIRDHLTRVRATGIVIQAMARGLGEEWVLGRGVPEGDRRRAINARISDARKILRSHDITTDLPAHPDESSRIRQLLVRLRRGG